MKFYAKLQIGLLALGLTVGRSLQADTIQVLENGVGANETVWITSSNLGANLHVYAGVLNLVVDGTSTTGFCIDPWHWSAGSALPYTVEALSSAPKSANNTTPNPMGAQTALQIEQLWAQYYTAGINNVTAAALQIKIWQLVDAAVDNGSFQLLSVDGADSASVYSSIEAMTTFLATNPNAAAADLVALTGSGQDYVVRNVPDSGSVLALLGLAFAGVIALRRKVAL
jgi:protein with PEP-CTERM/exosortase system signal